MRFPSQPLCGGSIRGNWDRRFDGVPPLHLEVLAVRAASLTTHISYRVLT